MGNYQFIYFNLFRRIFIISENYFILVPVDTMARKTEVSDPVLVDLLILMIQNCKHTLANSLSCTNAAFVKMGGIAFSFLIHK